MSVKHCQVLPIGEHTWEAVISISADEANKLARDINRVFLMKTLKYNPETREATVTLEPGNGMIQVLDESCAS